MTSESADGARSRILGRIREALADRSVVEHPGELVEAAGPPAPRRDEDAQDERIAMFSARFEATGGEIVRVSGPIEARAWLSGFSGSFETAATSTAVEPPFRPELQPAPPELAEVGVSWAVAGAAQTGSLVLSSREGRRVQLFPPVHLIWIEAAAIHATLGEALESLRHDLPAAVGLHTGPSRSADIGGIVVKGVHGPGRVIAAIVG